LRTICQSIVVATGVVAGGLVLVFSPNVGVSKMARLLRRIPKLGTLAVRLLTAMALYRQNRAGLALSLGLSLAIHTLLTLSIYLAALGMFEKPPSWGDHLVACPLALLTGVLPLPLSGLGALEFVLEKLYPILSPDAMPGQGLLAAFAYRGTTIVIAIVGLGYYLSARKEVSGAIDEVSAAS
jgi:uncharacterized membrane protein YbhN (UPF0104 family)